MTCFDVVIISVAPRTHLCGFEIQQRIGFGIVQPKWNIHAFDFINVIFVFENLRQKPFSRKMLHKAFFCRFFVKLERDNIIRTKFALELSHHDNMIAAERAICCRHIFVTDNFATARFA